MQVFVFFPEEKRWDEDHKILAERKMNEEVNRAISVTQYSPYQCSTQFMTDN